MNFMTIRSAPAREAAECRGCLSRRVESVGIIWSATAAMQWNECCRSAHGGGPGTAGAVNCTWKRRRNMKFTYPAIIRKQDNGTWKAWLPDLACCEAVGILWMMPLKKSMQQSMTGSVWSCLRTRRTFRLYPTWMTWTLSRAM